MQRLCEKGNINLDIQGKLKMKRIIKNKRKEG
jgi:hypothetical protein